MVLLEAALAIPLLLLVVMAGLATVRLAVDELAVASAARDAAVEAARGAPSAAVADMVRRRVPGAEVAVVALGSDVRVSVAARTSVVPGVGRISIRHEASYQAVKEPGT